MYGKCRFILEVGTNFPTPPSPPHHSNYDGSLFIDHSWTRFPQVDEVAFAALEECISSGNFEVCEAVPAGDPNGFLVNPLGGIPVDMAGPSG